LAQKRKEEKNAILKTVKKALPEYEVRRKLYPLFEIKDESVADIDREYVIRKRPGKHFFTKSSYFKISSGEELVKCLKTELHGIQSESECNPDKGYVKLVDDKTINDFFQSCIDDRQIIKIQSRTGEKINKDERTRIRKTVSFYRGVREASKFHVFYEHPKQIFESGVNDRYMWLEDDRWTREDYCALLFFIFSSLYMIKVFLPNFFWDTVQIGCTLLFYVPLIAVGSMFVSSVAARCMTVLMYAASRGKVCRIYLPNVYKGTSFRSLFYPLSVSYEREKELSHYQQVISLLNKYSSYGAPKTDKTKKI